MKDVVNGIVKLLTGYDKDTVIFAVIVLATMGALVAKAPPFETIVAACLFWRPIYRYAIWAAESASV